MPSEEYIKKYTHKKKYNSAEIQKPFDSHHHIIPNDLKEITPIIQIKKHGLMNHELLDEYSKRIWNFIQHK